MLVPTLLILAASSSLPDAIPRLNIEPGCRAASSFNLAESQSFAECMRDEADAKTEISKNWINYPAATRARCGAEVLTGGTPSYVDLYECLDIDRRLLQAPAEAHEE
jgi:hypothetical protein